MATVIFINFCAVGIYAQEPVLYTSPGTHFYTVPAGVNKIKVEAVGGGGAGGGVDKKSAGGGGAGGAYASKIISVVPGRTYAIYVGNGGKGYYSYSENGEASVFSYNGNTLVKASGGACGVFIDNANSNGPGGSGSTYGSIGDNIFAGGDGAYGNHNNPRSGGAGGGGAGSDRPGLDAQGGTGGNSSPEFGGRGANAPNLNSNGLPGSLYGGGGSGANHNSNNDPRKGGDGANGIVVITIEAGSCINSWTGEVSNDWNNESNWSCKIPTLDDDATIPSDLQRYPELISGVSGEVKNLIIESGASLTINNNTLKIAGTIENSGTFDATLGTVEMAGNTAQEIPVNCFLQNSIKNLTVNNAEHVTLNGTLKVTGIVKAQNGNLVSDGNLILSSSSDATALIDGSGAGQVTGNVTMERFIPSAFGYKYFSSPFQSVTVAQYADDVDLNAPFPAFWIYDETNEATGWEEYTDPSASLEPGKGYALNFGSAGGETTVTTSGVVNNGSIGPVVVTNNNNVYTDGFNLAGNPYPSPIDWDAQGWVRNNVDDAIWYFDAGNEDPYVGTYSSYINGVSSDGEAGPVIAAQQGFFVHATDDLVPTTGSITFSNTIRVNNLNAFYHKNNSATPLIRISAGYQDSPADNMAVYFNDEGSDAYNPSMDALKMLNTDSRVPNIYHTSSDGRITSIKSFRQDNLTKVISITVTSSMRGRLTIAAVAIEELNGFNVYLKDKYSGIITDLRLGTGYDFDMEKEKYDDRFVLIITKETLKSETLSSGSFKAYCANGMVHIEIKLTDELVSAQLTDINGKILLSSEFYGEGKHTLGKIPATGIGVITLYTGFGAVSQKILLTNL